MKPRMSLDLIVVFGVLDTRWLGNRMAELDMGWLALGYNGPLGYTVMSNRSYPSHESLCIPPTLSSCVSLKS